ncbi:hypothetical protein OROGR_023033 [Orobanche gracilis]
MVEQLIVGWAPGDQRGKLDSIPHYGKKYAAAKAAKLAIKVATSSTSRPATHGSRSHPAQSAPPRTTPVSRPTQSTTAPTTTNKVAAATLARSEDPK